jgi:hypothetical protein
MTLVALSVTKGGTVKDTTLLTGVDKTLLVIHVFILQFGPISVQCILQ